MFAGAESITEDAFAVWRPDETGKKISIMLHQAMAMTCLMVAIILFFARDLEPSAGAKVLMGAGIGIAVTTLHGFYNKFSTEVEPPLPLLLLMSGFAIVALVTATKAKG